MVVVDLLAVVEHDVGARLAVDRHQPDMVGAECFRPVTTRSFFVPSGY